MRLLNRTTRSVAPTEAGARFAGWLSPALGDIQAALTRSTIFADSPLGRLRINAPRPACEQVLAPLVCRFWPAIPACRWSWWRTMRWWILSRRV